MGARRRIARAAARRDAVLEDIIAEARQRRLSAGGMSPWELPAVVSCRRVIADTVMQLPLIAVKDRRPSPRQPAIYRRPDPSEPYWLSMKRTVDNLTGPNGHVWFRPTAWDAAGWPLALEVVDGDRATATFDPFGNMLEIWHDGRAYLPNSVDGIMWLPFEVMHKGEIGRSPIERCFRACEYLAALYDMAGSFWESGFPSLAVMIQQRLSPEDVTKIKDQVIGAWSRRHEPAVIDNNGQLAPVSNSAVESQLVESINTANTEIARAYGCMPSIVNVAAGDSLTYATTGAEFQKWKALGLGGYLVRVESVYTDMAPYGTSGRFDMSELYRGDQMTQAQINQIALAGQPWLTVDEVRDSAGLGPLPGGNAPVPNVTSTPAITPAAATPALAVLQ